MRVAAVELDAAVDVPTVVRVFRRFGPVVALESALPSAAHGGQSLVAGCPLATLRWQDQRAELNDGRAILSRAQRKAVEAAPTAFAAADQLAAMCLRRRQATVPLLAPLGFSPTSAWRRLR